MHTGFSTMYGLSTKSSTGLFLTRVNTFSCQVLFKTLTARNVNFQRKITFLVAVLKLCGVYKMHSFRLSLGFSLLLPSSGAMSVKGR